MSCAPVAFRAHAKVNLSLAVGGVRRDGFHEIESLLLALDLSDRVEVAPATSAGIELAVSGPASGGVPGDASNLAARAASGVLDLARARGKAPAGLRVELEKHVPAAAGLGGGSSDAVAAALASARVLDLDDDDPALGALLAALGSDCPFFHRARESGVARCTGRGEVVEVLPRSPFPWAVALVAPAFGCSTAEVYRAFDGEPAGPRRRPPEHSELVAAPLAAARALLFNDLEGAALRVEPRLAGFRALLESVEPGAFRLAGSGSSWFALCADDRSARSLLASVVAAAKARNHALRGHWVARASGRGVALDDAKLHS